MTSERRRAFTLLEILLVILVIGIVAGAVVPLAIDAVEGVRLRAATRELVALHLYARNRALLDKRPVAILYDVQGREIELLQLPAVAEVSSEGFLDLPPPRAESSLPLPADGEISSLRRKTLASFVTLAEVVGLPLEQGTWYAIYTPGGLCPPHSATLRDNHGGTMTVHIQGLTGDIRVEDR